MTVKYTTQQIFWKPDSEDKPSLTYFEEFKKSFISGDIKVNFLNYDNVEIVGKTDNITYIWINLNGKDYYYYTNSIIKVLNNGFTYNLFLDTFTSFTLPFVEQLKENNVTVYSFRSHYHTDNYLKYSDEMMNNIPKIYNNQTFKICEDYITINDPNSFYKISFINNNSKEYGIGYRQINQPINGCLYYVFSKTNEQTTENSYYFIPCLDYTTKKSDYSNNIEVLIKNEQSGWRSLTPSSQSKYYYNSTYNLEKFKNDNSNIFIGVYILPNILTILQEDSQYTLLESQVDNNCWVWGLSFNNNEILLNSLPILNLPTISKLEYNSEKIGDKYLLNYMNYKYYNNDLNINLISNDNKIDLNGFIVFAGNCYLYSKKALIDLKNCIYSYPYQLNSLTNTYLSYIQQSWNQVNTSYSIAQQNALWDSIRNVFSGGIKLAGSIATGNVAGAVSAVSGSMFSLAGTQLNLSQKRRMIQAQYKDARNCYGNKLNFSSAEDCSWKEYLFIWDYYNKSWVYEFVTYSELSESTIIKLNNILYLYGWFEPQYININTIINYNFNNFRYILLDEEHTDKLINNYSTCFIKYRESILNDLTSGIRLWDVLPNYGQTIQ